MIFEGIGGIVGGADAAYVEFSEDAIDVKISALKNFIGLLPDAWSGSFVEQLCDTEVAAEFEMCPVVEGISESVRDGTGPSLKFFVRSGVSGAEAL